MKKLFFCAVLLFFGGIVLLLAIGAALPDRPKTPTSASHPIAEPAKDHTAQFEAAVLTQIGHQSSKWQEVRFDEISKNDLRMTIVYRRSPSGYPEVERDTRRVARAALRALVAQGRNPHAEWISVFVHATQPETGETGADLTRVYGETSYDFNNDSLTFERAQ